MTNDNNHLKEILAICFFGSRKMIGDNNHLKEILAIRLTEELLKDHFKYPETRIIEKWANKFGVKIIELQEEMNLEYKISDDDIFGGKPFKDWIS